jgi:hypothetical protein
VLPGKKEEGRIRTRRERLSFQPYYTEVTHSNPNRR